MKKNNDFAYDYVRKISTEDLKTLNFKMQKLSGDYAYLTEYVSKDKEIDRILQSASSSQDFFDIMDTLEHVIKNEYLKRMKEDFN